MMDAEFWLTRWREGRTGWQQPSAGDMLVQHFAALALPKAARVLVPLCGATPDIGWLRAQGYAVAGAELSGLAIGQVFDRLGAAPQITDLGRVRRHSAPGIDLFEGDIFDLTPALLGPVQGVYDRAALFALPPGLRPAYAAHLVALTQGAPQLLACLEHGSDAGPPYSVTADEVARLYGAAYRITLLADMPAHIFASGAAARDKMWHLARV